MNIRSKRGDRKTRALRLCATATLIALVSLSVSCASDPQKGARQELQTLSSWAATLRLLADSWREGSVPSRYAAKTADEAHEALQEEWHSIEQSTTTSAEARAGLSDHARTLDALAATLAQAVRNENREAAGQLIAQLSDEQKSVDELARGAGAGNR